MIDNDLVTKLESWDKQSWKDPANLGKKPGPEDVLVLTTAELLQIYWWVQDQQGYFNKEANVRRDKSGFMLRMDQFIFLLVQNGHKDLLERNARNILDAYHDMDKILRKRHDRMLHILVSLLMAARDGKLRYPDVSNEHINVKVCEHRGYDIYVSGSANSIINSPCSYGYLRSGLTPPGGMKSVTPPSFHTHDRNVQYTKMRIDDMLECGGW